MKKSRLYAVLAAGALLLAGCGKEAKTIDAGALADSLVSDIAYDDALESIDANTASIYVNIPEGVEVIMYMGSGQTAEEVAVFTAPDADTAATMKENVQQHLDDQTASFEDYIPEEAKRVEDAVLEQKGSYVILCVSGDSTGAKEIIEEAFK